MRIWDINPGYLNRQSLLGEHLELHAIVSVIINKKKGYSKHPETQRWKEFGWALQKRHQQLSAEMALRGFSEKSPVAMKTREDQWPDTYIDEPVDQFQILATKYRNKEQGRVPLPKTAQQLWSHHKYSVLARDVNIYKQVGREVSIMKPNDDFSHMAITFTELLRKAPSMGGLQNGLQHMWGHVSQFSPARKGEVESRSLDKLLSEIQTLALENEEQYLLSSTALSELKAWLPKH